MPVTKQAAHSNTTGPPNTTATRAPPPPGHHRHPGTTATRAPPAPKHQAPKHHRHPGTTGTSYLAGNGSPASGTGTNLTAPVSITNLKGASVAANSHDREGLMAL